jgi:hypothetical protein
LKNSPTNYPLVGFNYPAAFFGSQSGPEAGQRPGFTFEKTPDQSLKKDA